MNPVAPSVTTRCRILALYSWKKVIITKVKLKNKLNILLSSKWVESLKIVKILSKMPLNISKGDTHTVASKLNQSIRVKFFNY